ncbi:tripartite tricarboxylate transporter TctB family protein [Sediminicoccus sp. KRV36]|uniref:tripartite tricarboxylate transporter TctB family protein n=1 Tax=Sediminicoccus sp. KRV36 TaxID=3133721 RepID=UPI00200CBC11|nr:tripartite tricarboxylate transporter TctB family protein [Sediminicoccus rosea]UPY34997.1 tripartite tricarboxylate transporter TctB family protein [Sediminicoccus rosea]
MTAGRVLGLLLLALAGLAIWSAQSLEVPFAADPLGPRAFPTAVALIMAACGALLLLPRGAAFEWPERLAAPPLLVVVMAGYALLLVPLGFLVATLLLASGVALLFGARPLAALVTGLITSAALWGLFDRVLDLPLPKGFLGI